jgi:hypothetical protein
MATSPSKKTEDEELSWNIEEESYLRDLSRLCEELSQKFKFYHDLYKARQAKFRIPSIIISSITGLASFGNSNFPEGFQNYVNIGVGACSIFIAILNSIESYMKIGEIIGGTLQASVNFQKLKETIDVELSLPVENRTSQGIIFLRQCYQNYEKYWDLAPNILRKMRFIRTTSGAPISTTPLNTGMKLFGMTPSPEKAAPTINEVPSSPELFDRFDKKVDSTLPYHPIQISIDK